MSSRYYYNNCSVPGHIPEQICDGDIPGIYIYIYIVPEYLRVPGTTYNTTYHIAVKNTGVPEQLMAMTAICRRWRWWWWWWWWDKKQQQRRPERAGSSGFVPKEIVSKLRLSSSKKNHLFPDIIFKCISPRLVGRRSDDIEVCIITTIWLSRFWAYYYSFYIGNAALSCVWMFSGPWWLCGSESFIRLCLPGPRSLFFLSSYYTAAHSSSTSSQ